METSDAIHAWRSIRKWKTDPVPDDVIKALLEAGRRAPSWENAQPWRFITVSDQAVREKMKVLAFGQKTIIRAPLVIAVAGDLAVWDRDQQRKALIELREAGAVQASDDIIEKVFLSNPAFAPGLRGDAVAAARTLEQVTYAISFILMEATNHGLGVCIVGAFGNEFTGELSDEYAEIKETLNLPETCMLMVILCIGYPDVSPPPRPRKPMSEIAFRERYGTPYE